MAHRGATDLQTQRSFARALTVVWAVLLVLAAGCSFGGPDLQSVADWFVPPSSWRIIEDTEVIDTLCLGPDCATVVMAWSASAAPTAAEFGALAQQAEWEDGEVKKCVVRSTNVTGPVPFCRATATSGDTSIELTASGPVADESGSFRITLLVSPK